jgi:inhibitor of KinA sporulation pathway (predicted exonuclease)
MPMPYFVVDLEATCDRGNFPRDQTEIIEIGGVLCDADSLEPFDEFQTFVQPIAHPQLTPFCIELTSITQDLVDTAPKFPEAIQRLADWLPGPVRFCSWGEYDRNQLSRDRHRHKITLPLGEGHTNLKRLFAERAGTRPMGMAEIGRAHV